MLYIKSTSVLNLIIRGINILVLFVNLVDLCPVTKQIVIVSS
jgi:hypothetical protein